MNRYAFDHDGLRFSYLDTGGTRSPLVMLHAHWMGASDFEPIFDSLSQTHRLIALDQRGHGETSHSLDLSVDGYVGDVIALLNKLDIRDPVIVLGHSFGAEVAYLLAARYPDRVRALVIEDMNVNREGLDDFIKAWSGTYPTRDALLARIGPRLAPYLQKSIRQTETGWSMTFDPDEILLSQKVLNGNHWSDWVASDCPTLIIRGAQSRVVPGDELAEMARRRPNTKLVTIDAGHSVHIDKPREFAAAVGDFLQGVACPA